MECIFVHSKCKTLIDCEVFKASRMIALSGEGMKHLLRKLGLKKWQHLSLWKN